MSTLLLLPARERAFPGESLRSLIRRHALAMGYDRTSQLLPVAGVSFPPHLDHLSRGPPLNALSKLLGQSAESLLDRTVHHFARRLMLVPRNATSPDVCDSTTILRFFASATTHVCPLCLAEPPASEQLLWSFRGLPICMRHGCALIDACPNCGARLRSSPLDLARCPRGCDLASAVHRIKSDELLAALTKLETVLVGNRPLTPELPDSSGIWWLERLASAATRTPSWLSHVRETHALPTSISDEAVAWIAATLMLQAWPTEMNRFLDVFQTVAKHRSLSTGVGRSFGLLLRDAQHLERLGYSAPADALREYLTAHFTLGHLNRKVCLFQDGHGRQLGFQSRPWLTQTEAGKRLHLRHGAIAGLVNRGVLEGQLHPAGQRGRSIGLVSRDSVERLASEQRTALPANAAAQRLGISRHRVMALIHANVLRNAVRTKSGWTVPLEEVDRLTELYHRLPSLTSLSQPWITARNATRVYGRQGLTLVRIISAVQSGQLDARRDPRHSTWRGLCVSSADLIRFIPLVRQEQDLRCGHALHRLAKTLIPGRPLKDVVLRKWIDAGLLIAAKQGRVWRVTDAEVARFRAMFCLADEIQQSLRIVGTTLTRWINAGRLQPVYSRRTHPGAGASVFLRADVEVLRREAAA
ncbi:MAG: TniQ family protein [Planctomycetales bacterium]|nr:TniQ family protein [Planctomycetales bacterium]